MEKLLILLNIILKVIEHLKFFVQSDEGVELVFKFDLLLLEGKLQLILLSLIEHQRRKSLLGNRRSGCGSLPGTGRIDDSGLGGCCPSTAGGRCALR